MTQSAALAAPPKRAEGRGESREYRQAVRAALDEFDAGNFPEARAAFTRAHELSPNARTFRGLGFVAFELRNYIECVRYLQAGLASVEKPLEGELRRSTEQLLARARGLLGSVRVAIEPRFDAILVDGVPAQLSEAGELTLEVGDHLIEVRAQGLVSERRELDIAGGEQLSLAFQLRAVEAVAAQAPGPRVQLAVVKQTQPRADEAPRKRWYRSPWLWTAVGVVVVGAGVGTYFALRPGERVERLDPATTDNTPPGGALQTLRSWQ